jgi:hypothetical protein
VNLAGKRGVWTAVVTIKRAATGKEETYNLVLTEEAKEENVPDSLNDGERRGDERSS